MASVPAKATAAAARRWWQPLLLILAAILLLALFSGEIRDTDIWLHLKTGEHTLHSRALTVPDPFSYTAGTASPGYPGEEITRYFNLTHEWLAQVAMYLLYSAAGFPGLVLMRALLLLAFCALAGWTVFGRTHDFLLSLAASLAAAGIAVHFQQSRPFLATFVFLALTVAILESGRRLWLLPPIFLFWANCHAGFVLGWLALGAYCGAALIRRLRKKPAPDERTLGLVAFACVLVSALNPNGFRVIQILFFYRSSAIQSANLEWQRPKFWEPGMYSFLLFGALLVLVLARRRARLVDWLLYLGFAAISLTAVRNVIFIGLVAPVVIASYLPRWRFLPPVSALLAAVFLLASALNPANAFAPRAALWQVPAGAADFIQAHHIAARMFNNYETGGYLVWRLWPLQRDFIDPRGLSEEVYADYRRMLFQTDSRELLEKYSIQMVVTEGFDFLSGQVYPLVVQLAHAPNREWSLVYQDAQAMVFMRHPPSGIEPLDPGRGILESLDAQCSEHIRYDPSRANCARGLGELYAYRGRPEKALEWIESYRKHRTEADPESEKMYQSLRVTALNNQALTLQNAGNPAGAEPLFRGALEIAEKALGPEHPDTAGTLNNLAGLLEAKGDYAGAEPLYRRALAIAEKTLGPEDPRTAMALDNLGGVLAAEGDVAAAEPLYKRALDIAQRTLGKDHETTRAIREDWEALPRNAGRLP